MLGQEGRMGERQATRSQLQEEVARLKMRLEEAEAALDAIRSGGVDALVVNSAEGDQIFTLQGADQPYRVMVETMNEGAASLLEDGVILYANRRLADILHEPLETLVGSSILDYIQPEDSKVLDGLVEQGFQGSSRGEVSFRCKDRSTIPVLLSFSPARVEGARALSMVAADLTEQKRSEEIVAAERLARAILDQAAEAILVCDSHGIVVRANQKALDTFPANPIYKRFEQALPLGYKLPEGVEREAFLDRVLDGESLKEIEAEYGAGGEENRYFLLSAAPLLRGPGQIIGCTVTLTEMTERKRAEELIRSYSARLEQSNKDLLEFAFIASHDLQEPLRKIESFGIQIGADSYLDATDRDYLRRMQDAAGRMRKMIDDLLELSRITTRGQRHEWVDLNRVAKTVVDDLEPRIRRADARVEVLPLPTIEADPVQMQQLLQNLVSNAVKFHRAGAPPQVEVGSRTPAPGQVEIYVRDNGIGFDPNHVEQIFQPFRRLVGRSEFEGNGIGLALCRKIVERHGGQITAISRAGEGATFLVTLPERQEAAG